MELIELLKILNDQGSRADLQSQVSQLREAFLGYVRLSKYLLSFFPVLLGCVMVFYEWKLSKLSKRIKKIELANGL